MRLCEHHRLGKLAVIWAIGDKVIVSINSELLQALCSRGTERRAFPLCNILLPVRERTQPTVFFLCVASVNVRDIFSNTQIACEMFRRFSSHSADASVFLEVRRRQT